MFLWEGNAAVRKFKWRVVRAVTEGMHGQCSAEFPLQTASGAGEPQWRLPHKDMSIECWWEQSCSSGEIIGGVLWPLPARGWSWALHKGEPHSTAWQNGKGSCYSNICLSFPPPPLHHKCRRDSWCPLHLRPGSAGAECLHPGKYLFLFSVSCFIIWQ